MIRGLLIFILFSVFADGESQAMQRDRYIDEIVLPTTYLDEEIETLLVEGYRGFIITSSSEIGEASISVLEAFMKEHPREFIGFIQQGTDHYIGDYLYSYFIQKTIDLERQDLPLCDSLLNRGDQILFFSDKVEELKLPAEDFLVYAELGLHFPRLLNQVYTTYNPENLFTVFQYNEALEIVSADTLFTNNNLEFAAENYIRKTGKIPNFILTDDPLSFMDFADRLPLYVKLLVLGPHNEPLSGVTFKEFGLLKSAGNTHVMTDLAINDSTRHFTESVAITPIKYGYRFLPEIFTFNYNNYKQYKIIHSRRIEMGTGLKLHFPLAENALFNPDFPVDIITSDLAFTRDKDHGKVAGFDGTSSAIYSGKGELLDDESAFSITLWAKPSRIDGNYPFFSKPGSYCLKIRRGKLCFTVVDKADLVSENSTVSENEWQHIGLVYEKNRVISFYINGVLTEVIPAMDYQVAESGITVGTDQWDEFYEGALSKLMVWNRPLGEDELKDIFAGKTIIQEEKFQMSVRVILLIFGVLLIVAGILFRFVRGKKRTREKFPKQAWIVPSEPDNETTFAIRYFGEFAIFGKHGKNRAEELSSKKRALLMVVLYHTLTADGISPQKLADTFWPGYNPQRAKNVRGTYMQDIRSVFSEEILSIAYNKSKWRITLNPSFQCDLAEVLALEKSFNSRAKKGQPADTGAIEAYTAILSRGPFAEDFSNEYVDPMKEEVSDRAMAYLEGFLEQEPDKLDEELKLHLMNAILKMDPVHEEVFKQKMELLLARDDRLGSQKCYDKFTCAWQLMFDEGYPMSIDDFNGA